ncbi:MAG TPA: alpha-glucan family phosphorylase [Chthonomonadaceae bacterium]|nr:alpha-glucan family phosphorylase [Chthonomonadaceae bacterium]
MPIVHAFHVVPTLPPPLDCLRKLAYNLHWAWDHEAIALFARLDRQLWEQSGHNPVAMLGEVSQQRLNEAAQDESFMAAVEAACRRADAYLQSSDTWFRRTYGDLAAPKPLIAYFSMEFGIAECLPIYSGGLGVLSGDHLKSSSDLGLPLVGVGLLYQQGYFRQTLNADGWQQERYPNNDFARMPLQLERDAKGDPQCVTLDFPGRTVTAQVWRAQVGRVPLVLLDTNTPPNSPNDQDITDQLYGGDMERRLQQEMVLGIGGLRALALLGIQPAVCHMNEGHSAFLVLERIRMLMQTQQVDFRQAREAVAAGDVFTTHTPVPAGFDLFPPDLLAPYFTAYAGQLGLSFDEFMGLGRVHRDDSGEKFNMAVLAMRGAHAVNGVSRLHGQVTRRMVQAGFAGFPEEEIPITSVTNGIHTPSFVSPAMEALLNRYLGEAWQQELTDPNVWARVADIPDEELWGLRQDQRQKLIGFARERLQGYLLQRGLGEQEIQQAGEVLDPHALTIGFARRFATYKRATLLLTDPLRLLRLLNSADRPVQILMAGKAHPRDEGGKDLIRQIIHFARQDEARHRIVFLEDYDLALARQMVQGVDVWLNTPRRPMEASGTSGMKVLPNGGLNLSVPDGWWAEAYAPDVGWSIGKGEDYADPAEQDRTEANALYELLENDVVPLFYARSPEGIPHAWIAKMKNSMRQLCPVYNTNRMVSEYTQRFYIPALRRHEALAADHLARARALVEWKHRIRAQWPQVHITQVEAPPPAEEAPLHVGNRIPVAALVHLGALTPQDVIVQAYHGLLDANQQITHGEPTPLAWKSAQDGVHHYEGEILLSESGLQGFSIRVLPAHPDAALPLELPLITWE